MSLTFDESAWTAAGIPIEDARHWWAHGIRPEDAGPWHSAGVSPKMAEYFMRHGRDPVEVAREIEEQHAENDPFLEFSERAGGRTDADVMNSYFSERWIDDQALPWARVNISAPHARVWIEFGIAPEDAAALVAKGETLASVIRQCWDAGFASSELAAWVRSRLAAET